MTRPPQPEHPDRPIVLVVGPTAGGKTELAVALARQLPCGGECVCADSMQVYRGLDIGTAKPTAAQRAAVPHHLVDLVEPDSEAFSVDQWLAAAETAIADIRRRGKWPIVVGGTNFYIQALLKGLADGPAPDPDLRDRLSRLDGRQLRVWLERVDPAAAERIHPNDRKRTIRAIEVHERSGARLSDLHADWGGGGRDDVFLIGLDYPAEAINPRINARVRSMIERGLVAEVTALHRAGRLGPQAAEALGYQQILQHLRGNLTLEEAIEQIKIRTRRFAKQQRTWLRRFRTWTPSAWYEPEEQEMEDIAISALTKAVAFDSTRRGTAAGSAIRLADGSQAD